MSTNNGAKTVVPIFNDVPLISNKVIPKISVSKFFRSLANNISLNISSGLPVSRPIHSVT